MKTLAEEMMAHMNALSVALVRDRPVTVDQEVWVRERIESAIRMAIAAFQQTRVRADAPLMASAINGIANGAAVEVIRTLGMKPAYVNLRPAADAPVQSREPAVKPGGCCGGGHDSGCKKDRPVELRKPGPTGVGQREPVVTCFRCGRRRPRSLLEWQGGRLVCTDIYACAKPFRSGGYGA